MAEKGEYRKSNRVRASKKVRERERGVNKGQQIKSVEERAARSSAAASEAASQAVSCNSESGSRLKGPLMRARNVPASLCL